MAFDRNRPFWDAESDAYQRAHGESLARRPLAWGVWRIAESALGVLGDVSGRRVLELGCGAAQWTCGLLQAGAHTVGLDASARQLEHARAYAARLGLRPPLVHGSAEQVPFRDGTFDIVFCDHGAMTFAAPEASVPEAARVLRPGGLLAFCISTPLRDICADPVTFAVTDRLAADYFSLGPLDDGHSVSAQLPYGAWIRLFRRHNLYVDDLIELQAPAGAVTTYADYVPAEWASRWPAEHIWKLRKAG
jgi:SAM-dependent methyltransferase